MDLRGVIDKIAKIRLMYWMVVADFVRELQSTVAQYLIELITNNVRDCIT